MKKMFGRGLMLAACLLMALVPAGPAMAAPAAYPCLFYGTATVDDEPVAADTEITAWVGGEQVGSALTGAGDLDANQFVLTVNIDPEEGAEVSFKIGELDAIETAAFVQYGAVGVDLTAYTEVTLVSIAVTPKSVSLNVGETQQLTITATYSDDSTDNVTADDYVSDDASVATVSTGGLITAVAEGEATITVSHTEDKITVTADVSVTVSEVVPVTWSCPVDHVALIAPYPAMGRPFLSTGADLSEVSSDADWFQVLWLDESTGEWKFFYSGFAENTLLTLEPDQYYYVIVSAPCDLTIPQ